MPSSDPTSSRADRMIRDMLGGMHATADATMVLQPSTVDRLKSPTLREAARELVRAGYKILHESATPAWVDCALEKDDTVVVISESDELAPPSISWTMTGPDSARAGDGLASLRKHVLGTTARRRR